MDQKPLVIAVVGPTASGKSHLAIELALALSGEVISADSRQVYRGMDIGTGKVTTEEMHSIPHHLLDICDPTTTYTASDFVHDANTAIAAILKSHRTPIIAGGTFFYLDILRGKMGTAAVAPNKILRTELEQLSAPELISRLSALDPKRAATIDTKNSRRLIRALEIATTLGNVPEITPAASPYNWTVFGIDISTEKLRERIAERLDNRLRDGMVEEVENLHKNGVTWERLDSLGLEYRYCALYLQNKISYDELRTQLFHKICQFAKRQRTWLRRDRDIIWLPFPASPAVALEHLQKQGFVVR